MKLEKHLLEYLKKMKELLLWSSKDNIEQQLEDNIQNRFERHVGTMTETEMLSILNDVYIDDEYLSQIMLIRYEHKYYVCLEYILLAFWKNEQIYALFTDFKEFRDFYISIPFADYYFHKLSEFYGLEHIPQKRIYLTMQSRDTYFKMNLYEVSEEIAKILPLTLNKYISKLDYDRFDRNQDNKILFKVNYKLIEGYIKNVSSL